MTEIPLWPDSPLVRAYLDLAREHHTGNALIDYAVLLAIIQSYANHHKISIAGRPFNVNFLLYGGHGSWAARAIDFGVVDFVHTYHDELELEPSWRNKFIDTNGQCTTAGLMDAANNINDRWGRQQGTFFGVNAANLFTHVAGSSTARSELVAFYANVLNGRPNIRWIRDTKKRRTADIVENPVLNAVWGVDETNLAALFAGVPFTQQLFLLGAGEPDRKVYGVSFTFDWGPLFDVFSQWQSFIELWVGELDSDRRVGITAEANGRLIELIQKEEADQRNEDRALFFARSHEPFVMLAAVSALAAFRRVIELEDVERAYRLLWASWRARNTALAADPETDMTTEERQRAKILERMRTAIMLADKEGLYTRDFYNQVGGFKHLSRAKRDDFVAELDQDPDVFRLQLIVGRHRSTNKFFSRQVWSEADAALVHPTVPPTRNDMGKFEDVTGAMHDRLEDCHGYNPLWDTWET